MCSTTDVHGSHFSFRKDHHQKCLLSAHLWQLQKRYTVTLGLEHLVPSWNFLFFLSREKSTCVSPSVFWLNAGLRCGKGFPFVVYLPVAFISWESYSLCLWEHAVVFIMELCLETNEEHDEERTFHIFCQIRKEFGLKIHFLTAHVPNVSLKTWGSFRS